MSNDNVVDSTANRFIRCTKCKDSTPTVLSTLHVYNKPNIHKKNDYFIGGICSICKSHRSKRVGFTLPAGLELESKPDFIAIHLPKVKPDKKVKAVSSPAVVGGAISNAVPIEASSEEEEDTNEDEDLITVTIMAGNEKMGEGLWDKMRGTFTGRTESAPRKFAKSMIGKIPLVGDYLVDSGLADRGMDWAVSNIWDPIKSFMGFSLNNDEFLKNLQNKEAYSDLVKSLIQKQWEDRVRSGSGIVPKYIKRLQDSESDEEKLLATLLLKTISKPKFNKYLKESNIPNDMKITDAVKGYAVRTKEHKSKEEKALNILKDLGYDTY